MNPVREFSLNGAKIPESIRDKKAVEKVLRQCARTLYPLQLTISLPTPYLTLLVSQI
jgi:hypothetical protein